jgi:hypothetical protein
MRNMAVLVLASGFALLIQIGAAWGYVGPGAGISMLGALWGVLVAILLTVGFLLFWPVRMLMRRRRRSGEPLDAHPQPPEASARKGGERNLGHRT